MSYSDTAAFDQRLLTLTANTINCSLALSGNDWTPTARMSFAALPFGSLSSRPHA
jgi:hypothetical protein